MTAELRGLAGLARSVRWTYLGVAVQLAVNLFLVAFAVRRLGPSQYGIFALFQGIASLLYVVDFGLGMGVVTTSARALAAEEPSVRSDAIDELRAAHQAYLRVGIAIAAMAVASLPSVWLAIGPRAAWALALLLLAAALNLGLAAPYGMATGARKFALLARSAIAGSLLTLITVVGLLPALGLAALGVGQLLGALAARFVLISGLRPLADHMRLRVEPLDVSVRRRVIGRATPLVFANVGNQAINTANLVLIASVAGTAAVGLFRAASSIPTQAVGLLFQGFDVGFPNIISAREGLPQERLAGDLTRIASYVGGVGFGWLIAERSPLAHLLLGRHSQSAEEVLALFALVWLINIPAHGLSLLLIARNCQRVFFRLTIFEAVVNIPLTVVLALRAGAPGAALASLISIAISNTVVFPVMARRWAPWTVRRGLVVDGYAPLVAGASVALAVTALLPAAVGPYGDAGAVAVVGMGTGGIVIGRRGRQLLRHSMKTQ